MRYLVVSEICFTFAPEMQIRVDGHTATARSKLKLKKDGFGESDADTTLEQVLARIKQQNNQPQTGAEDQAKQ